MYILVSQLYIVCESLDSSWSCGYLALLVILSVTDSEDICYRFRVQNTVFRVRKQSIVRRQLKFSANTATNKVQCHQHSVRFKSLTTLFTLLYTCVQYEFCLASLLWVVLELRSFVPCREYHPPLWFRLDDSSMAESALGSALISQAILLWRSSTAAVAQNPLLLPCGFHPTFHRTQAFASATYRRRLPLQDHHQLCTQLWSLRGFT